MTLKKYLKSCKDDVAIQLFDDKWNIDVYPYSHKEVANGYVKKDLLNLEVMDTNFEDSDNVLEIWVK